MTTDQAIWTKFHIKRGDILPYTGWAGSRFQLAELFGDLKFNNGAEIGVYEGEFSEVLLQNNAQLQLSCVDSWASYHHAGHTTPDSEQDAHYQIAANRLTKYPGAKIMRMPSLEAVKQIPDNSLDFVYIDALHEFDPVMVDIIHWAPKVKPGGIVSGHDYCHAYLHGVVHAVDTYVRGHNISSWYLTIKDKWPSWLWVKQ